jgi:hypothetical protein
MLSTKFHKTKMYHLGPFRLNGLIMNGRIIMFEKYKYIEYNANDFTVKTLLTDTSILPVQWSSIFSGQIVSWIPTLIDILTFSSVSRTYVRDPKITVTCAYLIFMSNIQFRIRRNWEKFSNVIYKCCFTNALFIVLREFHFNIYIHISSLIGCLMFCLCFVSFGFAGKHSSGNNFTKILVFELFAFLCEMGFQSLLVWRKYFTQELILFHNKSLPPYQLSFHFTTTCIICYICQCFPLYFRAKI